MKTADLIAQLNADLKKRDPFELMKKQIRERTVVEMENEGVVTWADDNHRQRFLED